jgi:CHRD domain
MRRRLLKVLVVAGLAVALVSALAMAATVTTAKLSGKSEVPKGDPNGSGTASITTNYRKSSRVCWRLTYKNIGRPAAAHIHKARAGKNGPVVVPLGATFKRRGCVSRIATKTIGAIERTPGSFYVNIHNARYPNGAIRGQLKK